jgi:hypothetical protein
MDSHPNFRDNTGDSGKVFSNDSFFPQVFSEGWTEYFTCLIIGRSYGHNSKCSSLFNSPTLDIWSISLRIYFTAIVGRKIRKST